MGFYQFELASKYFTFPRRLTKISMMKFFKIADKTNTNRLSLFQFEDSLEKFREALAAHVLERRGLSQSALSVTLIRDVLVLLLILIFLFMGISSFTQAGGFEATINSLLPIAAGLGVTLNRVDNTAGEEDMQDLSEDIDDALAVMTEVD